MFVLYAEKNQLTIREKEPVTSGSVNVYLVRFEFSADWDGMKKAVVFQAGCREKTVALSGGACTVPADVLSEPGYYLMAGVCGRSGETVVLPTVWANLGLISEGAVTGEAPEPVPPPDGWQEALDAKGDSLGYTYNGELGLYSGDRLLSSVPIESGGGEGGTTDHRRLSNRDAAEQHPITSISGLEKELNRIPEPVEALTNTELEEMLK